MTCTARIPNTETDTILRAFDRGLMGYYVRTWTTRSRRSGSRRRQGLVPWASGVSAPRAVGSTVWLAMNRPITWRVSTSRSQ